MKNRRMTVPWKTLLLLGFALGWPSLSQAASCTISPQNPSISTGRSVAWSATYSGFRRSPRYSWTFSEGQPRSSESRRPVPVTYPQAGAFTTSLQLGSEETTATCSTTVQVGAQESQGGAEHTRRLARLGCRREPNQSHLVALHRQRGCDRLPGVSLSGFLLYPDDPDRHYPDPGL